MKGAILIASAVIPLALAGCQTPAQTTVAEVAVALTGADQAALRYAELPRCPQSAGVLCSDGAKVAQIKTAAQTAYDAVKTAEASGAAGDRALAVSAVGALSVLIPVTK